MALSLWSCVIMRARKAPVTSAEEISRSRRRLWRSPHPAPKGNGHPRPADLSAVAMAKRICGEAHSDRSGGIALTMSLSSVNRTFAICSIRIKDTTTTFALTYR